LDTNYAGDSDIMYIYGNFAFNILDKIPDEPQISINNYLLDLIGNDDCKERSIYLNNASDIIKDLWMEIIQGNWRGINVRKFIPEKLDITPSVFYAYKNGRKRLSIPMMYKLIKIWQELCNKNEKEVSEKWDYIYESELLLSTRSKCQRTALPRVITPKLSYLLGWVCGDGNLQEGKRHYIIKISEKSKEQLELILRPLFEDVFGVSPPIFRRYGKSYAIQIGSKAILRFLKNVIKVRVGEIPSIVSNFDIINKKYFLMGIFDAEGHVKTRYLDPGIVISQSSKDFLEYVIKLFKELDIFFTGPYRHETKLGRWYTIRLRKKNEIIRYCYSIGTCHVEKRLKLQKLVEKIEKNRCCKPTVTSR
jgi:hypothetical protein